MQLDASIHSPPAPDIDAAGASRTEGGTTRANALGNVYNIGDLALEANPREKIWGKVRVFLQPKFLFLDPTTSHDFFVAKIRAYSTLGPLIVDLAKKNDSISSKLFLLTCIQSNVKFTTL